MTTPSPPSEWARVTTTNPTLRQPSVLAAPTLRSRRESQRLQSPFVDGGGPPGGWQILPEAPISVRRADRPYGWRGAWIVVGGLATQPWRARVTPSIDTAATAKARRERVIAKSSDPTIREVIFTTLTNMRTP